LLLLLQELSGYIVKEYHRTPTAPEQYLENMKRVVKFLEYLKITYKFDPREICNGNMVEIIKIIICLMQSFPSKPSPAKIKGLFQNKKLVELKLTKSSLFKQLIVKIFMVDATSHSFLVSERQSVKCFKFLVCNRLFITAKRYNRYSLYMLYNDKIVGRLKKPPYDLHLEWGCKSGTDYKILFKHKKDEFSTWKTYLPDNRYPTGPTKKKKNKSKDQKPSKSKKKKRSKQKAIQNKDKTIETFMISNSEGDDSTYLPANVLDLDSLELPTEQKVEEAPKPVTEDEMVEDLVDMEAFLNRIAEEFGPEDDYDDDTIEIEDF